MENRYQEALERFILFWGEMASNWGINRTMAQIHALLYASEASLDTDTIMARLKISRGNANMNLHALINWNLVRKVHQPGSRKDFFTAEKDVWYITQQIVRERERREIQPVRQQLEECQSVLLGDAEDATALSGDEQALYERIQNLQKLMQVFEGFSKVLLPFIEEENAQMLNDMIEFGQMLNEKEESNTNASDA